MSLGFMLDAPTIVAITGLIAMIGNLFMTWDARRRTAKQLVEIKHLANGQSEKLSAVSKALGHAEGMAEQKESKP
jgi:FtsZ-interacting cell division protein ZipA